MNLCAGSDPSLNFPKPITFSQATKPQNHKHPTISAVCLSTHSPTTSPPRHCHLPCTHPIHHPIINLTLGVLAVGYTTAKSPTPHPLLPFLLTQTTSAPRLASCQTPIIARLHRNFIFIRLSHPIRITHTSPDTLLLLQRLGNMRLEGSHH